MGIESRFAKKRAALDVCVTIIGAVIVLDNAGDEESYLPVTGVRYLLTGRGCTDQIGHNTFEVREGRIPGLFVIFFGSKAKFLLVCPAMHTYVYYLMSEMSKLAELPGLEALNISA